MLPGSGLQRGARQQCVAVRQAEGQVAGGDAVARWQRYGISSASGNIRAGYGIDIVFKAGQPVGGGTPGGQAGIVVNQPAQGVLYPAEGR